MADITIKDIAKRCGVGVSTVSRAINNHPDINPATRERIMAVVQETGFVPNDSARCLKRTETNSIALLVTGISNPMFTEMIRIMEAGVEKRGYSTILRHVGPQEEPIALAQTLVRERKVRGIVFLGGEFVHDVNALEQIGVPFVFATVPEDPSASAALNAARGEGRVRCVKVSIDDTQAGYDAAQYLMSLGHERIGLILQGLDQHSVGQLRFRGFTKAMSEQGLAADESRIQSVTQGPDHFTMRNGYNAAAELIARCPDLSAIFCFSDVLAIGACRGLIDAGRRIPEDVSVLGCDGIEMGEYMNPRLSTLRQPFEDIAGEAVRLLFEMIDDKDVRPADHILRAAFTPRESTGTGPRGRSEG